MRKLSVSVGIPAYDEEGNIKKLLLSLLNQKGDNFLLKEIIIVSDSSRDNTSTEVKGVKSKKVILIENRKRLGQAKSQNKIIKQFKGEILVLLNADTLPSTSTFIDNLILPFLRDKNVGLVGPKTIPLDGNGFFENIINYSIDFKDAIFERVNKGSNLYLCSGRGRAFKRELAKQIKWKSSLSEDAYSYLTCIKTGYKFKYNSPAKLYFKSPDNFSDHIKQSGRFTNGPKIMSNYFDSALVIKEYRIPKKDTLISSIRYFFRNPLLFLAYILVLLRVKFNPNKEEFAKSKWDISKSSKTLTITT